MKRVMQGIQLIAAAALVTFGGLIGAAIGFSNAGWVGALCLGMAGVVIGAALAAGGLSGVLQMLRVFG